MREIKFRAWEVYVDGTGVMRQVHAIDFGGTGIRCDHMDDEDWDDLEVYILMQYTGLKDKNGREIYEGDILRMFPGFGCEWSERTVAVKWDVASFWVEVPGKVAFILDDHDATYQVIGNIYENPELLGGK